MIKSTFNSKILPGDDMKRLSIFLIKKYKIIPISTHFNCKYIPTCSDYALEAINTYGFFKGWYLTIKRILRCAPWGGMGYDPVPERKI